MYHTHKYNYRNKNQCTINTNTITKITMYHTYKYNYHK